MIDEKELQLWISRLETEKSSWTNYEKLATLYTIQNQNRGKAEPRLFVARHADIQCCSHHRPLQNP